MKTGILTFHDGINYGAFMQVYSMQCCLQSLGLGMDVSVINYKSRGFEERERACFILPGDEEATRRNREKIRKFEEAHRLLQLTNRMSEESELSAHHFDRVVIGADEVWNFSTELIGFDPVYFSQGVNADKIISYAPSFGCVNVGDDIPVEVQGGLKRLSSVSVRDENAASVVESILGHRPPVVLDPTFLVDHAGWAEPPDDAGYILVYGFFTPPMVKSIRKYAARTGRKLVAVGYHQDWCDENHDALSPSRWLGFFQNAGRVMTTMFHGMIYSILSERNFAMFVTDYRRNKVGTLLEDIGLGFTAIAEDTDPGEILGRDFDYAKVTEFLDAKRAESLTYLKTALGVE